MIELLVAMAAGSIVVIAIAFLLVFTMRAGTRVYTKVDATSRARTQLAQLEYELQSACLSGGVSPIQSGSTPTSMTFLSAYGNAASPTPTEHVVSWNSATGTLTDAQYAETGGSSPDWTFASTPTTTTTLLTNVGESGSTSMFQYFAYQEAPNGSGGYYTDGAGDPYMMLLDGTSDVPGTSVIPTASPLTDTPPSGLSSTNAEQAAEVLVTMYVGATGGSWENTSLADGPLTVTDSIVLRLTPPPNNTNAGTAFDPCE